jgi:hypothetical protein
MKNKLFTLAAALTLAAVISSIYAAPALAAIKAALVQSVDEPGRHPIAWTFNEMGFSSLAVDLPPVLAGKRVVTQQISMQVISGPTDNTLYVRTSGGPGTPDDPFYTQPLTPLNSNSEEFVTAPMVGYVDGGKRLRIQLRTGLAAQRVQGTVTGYMIDCTSPGSCD